MAIKGAIVKEEIAKKIASKELGLSAKDRIVITGGDTTGHSGTTNLIKIDEI